MTLPTRLTNDINGIATYGTYTGTNKQCVQSLIDLIAPDDSGATLTQRGHLDEMSPAGRIQLLAELEALLAAVENV